MYACAASRRLAPPRAACPYVNRAFPHGQQGRLPVRQGHDPNGHMAIVT
jgi:hypothetical protein